MRIGKIVVIGLLALVAGCGESVEHKLEQAKISLNSGRPDVALTYAQAVLDQRPDDQAAMLLMGKAQLRLRRFEASRQLLSKLVVLDSAKPEPHRELLNLALAEMGDILKASDFSTDAALAERFTAAKTLGHEQADWLATTGKARADGEFARARLLILDAQRIERFVREETTRIRSEAGLRETDAPISSPAIEEQRRQIKSMHFAAENNLEATLAADPAHFPAAATLARLLRTRESWGDLWVLAGKLQERQDLPPALASELVGDLLLIPEDFHPEEVRMAACRKLMSAVTEQGQASSQWKVVRARLYLRDHDKEKAMELALESFRAQPSDVEARLTYAWCLYETGQFPLAKTILDSLAIEQRDHEHVQLLYGLTLAQTGDRTLAVEALRKVTELNPSNQIARAAFVRILSESRNTVSAVIEDVNKLYLSKPGDPEAIRFKFIAEVATGTNASIQALLDAVEKLSPRQLGHLRILVDGYSHLRDYDKALRFANEAVELQADDVQTHLALAKVHLLRNEDELAKKTLIATKKTFPGQPAPDLLLAQLYLDQGQYDRVIEITSGQLKLQADQLDSQLLLARAYARLAMSQEALEQVEKVLERNAEEPRALELAASIYRTIGQPAIAKNYLERIDESTIIEEEMPGVLAQLKLKKGDIEEAKKICERAVAAGRADSSVRMTLAAILNASKNVGEEEVHLVAMAREQPGNLAPYLVLVRFYGKNNVERGLAQFRSLRDRNDSHARLGEAMLLSIVGRSDEAFKILADGFGPLLRSRNPAALTYARYMAAILMAPGRADVAKAHAIYQTLVDSSLLVSQAKFEQMDLVWSKSDEAARMALLADVASHLEPEAIDQLLRVMQRYASIGRFDAAERLIDQWCHRHPTDARLIRAKIDLFVQASKYPQAIELSIKSLEIDSDQEAVYHRLAKIQVLNNDYPGAAKTYDAMALLHAGAKIRALWSKGSMFADLGLNSQAVKAFEELDEIGRRSDPRVWLAMGQGLMRLGRDEEASRMLTLIPPYAKGHVVAQMMLVKLDQRAGRVSEAKRRLGALAKDPRMTAAAVQEMIELSVKTQDDAQVLAWSDQVLALPQLDTPLRIQWLGIRGAALARVKNWTGVEKAVGDALKAAPQSPELHASRIVLLIHLDQTPQAAEAYAKCQDLLTEDHRILLGTLLGRPQSAAGNPSPLAGYLDGLLRGDAKKASSALAKLGGMFESIYAGDLVASVDQLVSPLAKSAVQKTAMALISLQVGLNPLCAELCGEAVDSYPKLALAHSIRLNALRALDWNQDVARRRIEKEIPDSGLAIDMKIYAKSTAGEFAQAIELSTQLLAREPQHVLARYRHVSFCKQTGDTGRVLAMLRELRPVAGPLQPTITNDLAYRLVLADPANAEEAQVLAAGVVEAYPQWPAPLDTLGWIEHLRGNNQAGIVHLLSAIRAMPEAAEIQYHLGVVYEALGNKDWARFHYESAAQGVATDPIVKAAAARLKLIASGN